MARKAQSTLSGLVPAARSPIIHEFSHTVNRYFDGSEKMEPIKNRVSRFDWTELYADHLTQWDERLSVALAAAHFESLVVFAGAERTRFRDDQNYPYAVEPYFKCWLPLTDHPGSVLKLTPGERPLLIDLREGGFWHEAPTEPGGFWVDRFEIRQAASPAAVMKELGSLGSGVTAIGEPAGDTDKFPSVNDTTLLAHLDYSRAYKTPYEVACIETANEIAAIGHIAAQRAISDGASEFDLHHVYCAASGQTEADLPYPNIIALNEHASILHYQKLRREAPKETLSFLIDAGAQCNGYASDITRTCARNNSQFAALIDSMEIMQQTLWQKTLSGTDFVELNDTAHRLVAGILKEHGLIRCGEEEAYAHGITRTFLPHGLGHLLGLQVHDVGGRLASSGSERREPPAEHPMLRLTRILEPGFVVTIEPGIYFIPSLLDELKKTALGRSLNWDIIETLLPCGGIRVEDDVLVTDTDSRNLTRPALLNAAES